MSELTRMLTTRARLKPAFPTHGIFHELYYVPLTYIPSLSACHKFVFYFHSFFEWLSGNAVVLFLPLLSSNRGGGILLPRLLDRLPTANVRRGKRRLRQRSLFLVMASGVCAGIGLGSLPVGCEMGCIEIAATCRTACMC